MTMTQRAPDPMPLGALVHGVRYKAGWTFYLSNMDRGQGSEGLTLVINIQGPDTYHPERVISVNHLFPVPPAAYDYRSWRRWLFEQILLVERHEAMEWFTLVDEVEAGRTPDVKPYAPSHGPGNDPYLVRELGTDEDRRTSFRGDVAS
jgi:hypothetical protein